VPHKVERSLFEELPELEDFKAILWRYGKVFTNTEPIAKLAGENKEKFENRKAGEKKKVEEKEPEAEITHEIETIRMALSVEVRDGVIIFFCRRWNYVEHYFDMVASIESTAAKLKMQVRIEGYEPPRDTRVERMVISPDPGVIEVNIHPAKNWKELLGNTDTLYEQARLSRLGTEKFMLDGRHTGTGGGNHITIGAAKPADSPLLRRPDLLRSLITFWQHHPGLSYLFSGSFIGPTSQAPRFDEGFEDRLYEMEIAFSQVPEKGFIPFGSQTEYSGIC
jgi:uncharacterized protein (DUF2126 family)